MPLKVGNGGNVEVYVVPGLEVKVRRPLYYKVDHFGRQDNSSHNITFAFLTARFAYAEKFFTREHTSRSYEPFPKIGSMNNQQDPEDYVEKVGPIKHLNIKATLSVIMLLIVFHY